GLGMTRSTLPSKLLQALLAFLNGVLAGQTGRVLVRAFSERTAKAARERDAGFAVFIAQAIGGRQGLLPPLVAIPFQKIQLCVAFFEGGNVHTEQANGLAFLPIVAEQLSDLIEDLGVELSGDRQRVGTREGAEVFVTEFQLNCTCMQSVLAQAATHHFS